MVTVFGIELEGTRLHAFVYLNLILSNVIFGMYVVNTHPSEVLALHPIAELTHINCFLSVRQSSSA